MRKFTRLPAPDYLEAGWEAWGIRYENNRLANNGHVFQWPQIEGEKLNQKILPTLMLQTQFHCSYCDGFPLGPADDTIDHFKPKSDVLFYREVCAWPNLYVACADCQKLKGTQFNDLLLRPDELDYEFNSYFDYNYTNHTIEILPSLTGLKRERAVATLEIFQFNHIFFRKSRQKSFELFNSSSASLLDDFAFRFIMI